MYTLSIYTFVLSFMCEWTHSAIQGRYWNRLLLTGGDVYMYFAIDILVYSLSLLACECV